MPFMNHAVRLFRRDGSVVECKYGLQSRTRLKERTALHCTNAPIRSMSAAIKPATWPKWPVSAAL